MHGAIEGNDRARGSLAERWADLHANASLLAALADLGPEASDAELAAFPAMVGEASEWQRELAWQGVDDIQAMLRPGLVALNTIIARGGDAQAPALTLWREYYEARSAVMALVNPE